ncbi:MAG: phospho-sugar mutase [Bacilli bacterium]|nr:phospho-sugar mutase [Bacilli bacterium]
MNDWLKQPNLDSLMRESLMKMTKEEEMEAFHGELSFGTGGMRGIVGPGSNRMNQYVLRRANYGFATYLLRNYEHPSCVIAYDSRHFSTEFAHDSARVLASLGVKVYVFPDIAPTPLLSFAVRYLKASGGIVITASHNPPKYNGYKVYDHEGCQLVPSKVEALVKDISFAPSMFAINPLDWDALVQTKMIEMVSPLVEEAYLTLAKTVSVYPDLTKIIRVMYSPLHGTGGKLASKLLSSLHYPFATVKEQMIPDPEFSTVKSPNPENVEAFNLAVTQAKGEYDLLVATDPDADRIGLGVLHQGKYHFLTGNQTGALLLDYLCTHRYYPGVVFNTIVTSDIGAVIARRHNLKVVSTLTGFKYIGEQAALLEEKQEKYFFGYEESYGYLVSPFVRDKDSLQSMLLIADMANYYAHQGKTLIDRLEEIYQEVGYFHDQLVNIQLEGIEGSSRIGRILDYFRGATLPFAVEMMEDYQTSVRKKGELLEAIALPKENVLKFFLQDGSWFVVRPSGTEPKMKLYLSIRKTTQEEAIVAANHLVKTLMSIIESVK